MREFQRQEGALEGKRKLEMERSKSYLYTKFFDARTQVGVTLVRATLGNKPIVSGKSEI